MSENVWEWMWDRFRYGGLDERVLKKSRVYRGGSWDSGMERAHVTRSRYGLNPTRREPNLGFRLFRRIRQEK